MLKLFSIQEKLDMKNSQYMFSDQCFVCKKLMVILLGKWATKKYDLHLIKNTLFTVFLSLTSPSFNNLFPLILSDTYFTTS